MIRNALIALAAFVVAGAELAARDALEVEDVSEIDITTASGARSCLSRSR